MPTETWHANRLCRGVPAAGRQPLSQGSWTNRVGWTPDGSYRGPRGRDLAFFINGLTTAFWKQLRVQCQMWDSDWLFSETQAEERQWIQERVWLEPGLRSLWLTLTREWVSGFGLRRERKNYWESKSLEWTLEAKFSVVSNGSSLNSFLIVWIFSWNNRENDLAASWGIMSGRESDLFSLCLAACWEEKTFSSNLFRHPLILHGNGRLWPA